MRIAPCITLATLFTVLLGLAAAPVHGQTNCKAYCIDDFEAGARVFWNTSPSGLGYFTFSQLRGGELIVDLDAGTLRIIGEIVDVGDPDRRFDVDITFSGRVAPPAPLPSGSPKLPDDPSLLVSNGGPVDPLDWDYYPQGTGAMVGKGDYDGAVVQIDIRGPAAQFGFGADLMDPSFGFSTWLDYTTLAQPTGPASLPSTWEGDINGNVARECADFPYPGSGDDFRLCTGINGPPTCGPGENVKSGVIGDTIQFKIESPNGTHAGKQVLFYVNCWNTCLPTPEFFHIPGFDFIYLTPNGGNVELFGPTSPFGFPALDAQGCLVFDIPILYNAFAGLSLLFQAYVVDGNALNGGFAASDAHRIDLGPNPSPTPAPVGVATGGVDEHGASVSWAPVDATPEVVDSYNVLVDGQKVGSTTGTSFDVDVLPELTTAAITVTAMTNAQFETSQSAPVLITTLADTNSPVLLGATATSSTTVEVRFDEPIDPSCANDTSNFSIDGGVSVVTAQLLADGHTVGLVTTAVSPPAHVLTVSGILDTAATPNVIAPNTQAQIEGARVTGDLVAFYSMDEGSGSVVHDTSGFGTPLDLQVADPTRVSWVTGGLSIDQATIVSAAGASKIAAACQASNEITLEAFVGPSSTSHDGPARIVTYSVDPVQRNFTLGQEYDDYIMRLRTDQTGANGTPNLVAANEVQTSLSHVVFTRDATGHWRIVIDGVEEASGQRNGVFTGWNAGWGLGLANEFSMNRPWLGEIHLVALYSRALSDSEILQNRDAGP